MKLWLVRHARPVIGTGICYGAMDVRVDTDLSAELVRRLAASVPLHACVMSSPARRCMLAAQVLVQVRPDLSLRVDDNLLEMNFGSWQGRAWSDIGQQEYEDWMADFGNHQVGGGERVNDLMARVAAALAQTRRLATTGEAVWMTHAGVIQAASLHAQGVHALTAASQWPSAPLAFGTWTLIEVGQS